MVTRSKKAPANRKTNRVDQIVAEIRKLRSGSAKSTIRIGGKLKQLKNATTHGGWLDSLAKTGYSARMAQLLMQIAASSLGEQMRNSASYSTDALPDDIGKLSVLTQLDGEQLDEFLSSVDCHMLSREQVRDKVDEIRGTSRKRKQANHQEDQDPADDSDEEVSDDDDGAVDQDDSEDEENQDLDDDQDAENDEEPNDEEEDDADDQDEEDEDTEGDRGADDEDDSDEDDEGYSYREDETSESPIDDLIEKCRGLDVELIKAAQHEFMASDFDPRKRKGVLAVVTTAITRLEKFRVAVQAAEDRPNRLQVRPR